MGSLCIPPRVLQPHGRVNGIQIQRAAHAIGQQVKLLLVFQDNKDGDIKIAGLSAGDEYGIFGMDLGMGARTAQECEEKLESLGGAS